MFCDPRWFDIKTRDYFHFCGSKVIVIKSIFGMSRPHQTVHILGIESILRRTQEASLGTACPLELQLLVAKHRRRETFVVQATNEMDHSRRTKALDLIGFCLINTKSGIVE